MIIFNSVLNSQIKMYAPMNEDFIGTEVESLIFDEDSKDGMFLRPFYRIRMTNFYGGCITADTVGCTLHCVYCWNYDRNFHPENVGKKYSPHTLVLKMWKLSKENDCYRFRISGAEPLLADKSYVFVICVINELKQKCDEEKKDMSYILETNGLYLGQNPSLCEVFSDPRINVRISLKGTNPEMFLRMTGTEQKYFQNQLNAIEYCKKAGVNLSVAVLNILPIEDIENLGVEINEVEQLHFYRGTKERMKKAGLIE
jgi:uncharacterized Fe-S cluster-containing radical SAM superfamily protein